MIEYSAGIVTAYGSAVRAGYTGTYEDFCRQQAGYAENAQAVEQAKNDAVTAKNTAVSAKDDAVSAKNTATTKAQEASQSATSASQSATSAGQSATNAERSANNAGASAQDAQQSAQTAQAVLESIPEDYSDLSEDVDKLKADLVDLQEGGYIADAQQIQTKINSWLAEHPDVTTTVQDRSLTEAKFTVNTLKKLTNVKSVYNALNYGISNKNSGNQAPLINALIGLCNDGDTVYLPNGEYRITESIIINKAIKFICDGVIRIIMPSETPGYGVVISKSYANVYIREADAFTAYGGCIQIYSSTESLQFVNLEFDKLAGSSSGNFDVINITVNDYYVAYINIKGKYIYASSNANGISCVKISQNATLGEVHIENTRIYHANNAIYVADENVADGNNVNSVCVINAIFEGNNNGCYFKNVRSPYLLNCRIAEQLSNGLIIFEGSLMHGGYVGRTPFYAPAIKFVNPDISSSWRSAFFVNAPIYLSYTDNSPRSFAFIYNGKIYTSPTTLEEYTPI